MIVKNSAELVVKINNNEILRKKQAHVQPSEMISFNLKKDDLKDYKNLEDPTIEVALV
jgi:hypothetical protein